MKSVLEAASFRPSLGMQFWDDDCAMVSFR